MSAIINLYIKKETLETLLKGIEKKGLNGIGVDVSINNESNKYDQDATMTVSQNKEDRQAKKPKFYIGNGRVVWTDGLISVKKKHDTEPENKEIETDWVTGDLPF